MPRPRSSCPTWPLPRSASCSPLVVGTAPDGDAGQVERGLRRPHRDGILQFAGAATAPAHRRHGIQNALLSRRMADAAAEGCDLAVIVTQPGSRSHQNAQRQGFHLLYTRAVLVKPPARSATSR